MKRTRIKICGLRDHAGVEACKNAGADAVGFVFFELSPRFVQPEQVAKLVNELGPWQTPVALFVNPEPAQVNQVVELIPNVLLQFHGDESVELCESFERPYLKAVRMKRDTDLLAVSQRFASAAGLLADSWSKNYGGSGTTFDWGWLPDLSKLHQPLILSGGLDEQNVFQALQQISPYGVDVSSGVERQPGVKCGSKIHAFCDAVYKADQARGGSLSPTDS